MIKKELYAAPATEVLELRLEGTVLVGSETVTPNSSGEDLDGWDL